MNLKKDMVQQLALEAGFKLKPQPDDLNPYVYKFADKLAATVAEDFIVILRTTYDELGAVMQELNDGSSLKAMKMLHGLRKAMAEVL